MLSKFILVSETCFQNTETALKNQQASIQGLKTQIGQLSKLISERPQGSLPSNTEHNPREQPNVINVQDEEGFVEPEPEPRQETVVSKGQGEVDHNTNKSVNVEYKPRVPYPNATEKNRSDEQFDVADPHIVTTTLNEEIPLTVLSIFPFDTVEVSHPKFDTFKVTNSTRPITRTCLRLCDQHERKHGRAIRPYENRVKVIFPNMGCDKWPWACDLAVVKSAKRTRACDTLVSSTRGQHCQNDTGMRRPTRPLEKRTTSHTVV
ncbi:hypothetical protein GOBAR_AA13792 [Gossypium barbadense]|uniref:Uncharacterized protein n=1 Tax=Gossypium barbadense TaxID=3634 RepID=A0A2P5XU36_GOSBA|nr:hypothetical protein GOBAR_AA13792 [Gossypium barbadense]